MISSISLKITSVSTNVLISIILIVLNLKTAWTVEAYFVIGKKYTKSRTKTLFNDPETPDKITDFRIRFHTKLLVGCCQFLNKIITQISAFCKIRTVYIHYVFQPQHLIIEQFLRKLLIGFLYLSPLLK